MNQWQGMQQRALSASASTPSTSDASAEHNSECGTTMGLLPMNQWQGMQQRALSASASTPSSSDDSAELNSECGTTMGLLPMNQWQGMQSSSDATAKYQSECSASTDDLTTVASLLSFNSGSEMGSFSWEPGALGERQLVSL